MRKRYKFNNDSRLSAGFSDRVLKKADTADAVKFFKKHAQSVKLLMFVLAVVICGCIYYLTGNGIQTGTPGGWKEVSGNSNVAGSPSALGGSSPQESTSEDTFIYVYVCGSVNEPGVYEVRAGARTHELIALAGGMTEEAASLSVPMAKEVQDGQTLYIPSVNDDNAPAVESAGDVSGSSAKININTASVEQLMTLKGIGESRAEDIVDYRKRNGSFKKTEDIMKVSGIKEAAYSKIKDDICVN